MHRSQKLYKLITCLILIAFTCNQFSFAENIQNSAIDKLSASSRIKPIIRIEATDDGYVISQDVKSVIGLSGRFEKDFEILYIHGLLQEAKRVGIGAAGLKRIVRHELPYLRLNRRYLWEDMYEKNGKIYVPYKRKDGQIQFITFYEKDEMIDEELKGAIVDFPDGKLFFSESISAEKASLSSIETKRSEAIEHLLFELRAFTGLIRNTIAPNINETRSIVITSSPRKTLGEEAIFFPLLIKSLIKTFPNLEKVLIYSPAPEMFERIDAGNVNIIAKPFTVFLESLKVEEEYDLHIQISSTDPEHVKAKHTIKYFFVFVEKFMLSKENVYGATLTEWLYRALPEVGLKVPDISEPILVRESTRRNTVFVNPHALTNAMYYKHLEEAWVQLIVALITAGKKVILNEGASPSDRKASESIEKMVNERIDVQGSFKVAGLDREGLINQISEVENIVTIDTGIFHIADLFKVPTICVTTPKSLGWVGKSGISYDAINGDDFHEDPASVIDLLRKLNLRTGKANLSEILIDTLKWHSASFRKVEDASKREIVIGVDGSWIPEEHWPVIQEHFNYICSRLAKKLGLDNVHIVRQEEDNFAQQLLDFADGKISFSNIIVLGSKNNTTREKFAALSDEKSSEEALLVGVNAAELDMPTGDPEKMNCIRLEEMLLMALDLAFSPRYKNGNMLEEFNANYPQIGVIWDEENGRFVFLPKAEPIDCDILKNELYKKLPLAVSA